VHKERFHYLIEKYIKNQISESELQELLEDLDDHEDDFLTSLDRYANIEGRSDFDQERIYRQILENKPNAGKVRWHKFVGRWWSVAAAVLILTIGTYYFKLHTSVLPVSTVSHIIQDSLLTLPEHADALLKLANGTTIDFNDSPAFHFNHDGVLLTKLSDGSIAMSFDEEAYHPATKGEDHFHLFSTPKGTSFSLHLPDGSLVFLNSDSKLQIPSDFNTSDRRVKLVGEGYFEVAHNKEKPFVVHTKSTDITVLGTHFNIKSYMDQMQVQTTLLEGAVRVNHENKRVDLRPGEQAVSIDGKDITKRKVNVQQIMAWKEGYFRFSNASIQEILEDIQRWYAIKGVDYEVRSDERFTGAIKRTRNLTEVLDNIEKISNIKFKIIEGRVIVMK